MKTHILLALLMIFSSCRDSNNNFKKNEENSKNVIEIIDSNALKKEENKIQEKKNQYVFKTHDLDLKQELECIFLSNKKVQFNVKLEKNNEVLNGIAELKETFDGETISDEEGNGYFVEEYECKIDGCIVVLRIDTEDFEVAKILIRNCKNTDNSLSKINTSDIMWRN